MDQIPFPSLQPPKRKWSVVLWILVFGFVIVLAGLGVMYYPSLLATRAPIALPSNSPHTEHQVTPSTLPAPLTCHLGHEEGTLTAQRDDKQQITGFTCSSPGGYRVCTFNPDGTPETCTFPPQEATWPAKLTPEVIDQLKNQPIPTLAPETSIIPLGN